MSKIYELAEQAAEHAVLNYSGEVLQSETEDVKIQIPKEFVDQFSKLLIRECMELTAQCKAGSGVLALHGDEIIADYFNYGSEDA